MLDGFWLFADADASVSREPARLDEFISLFKHACLLQRQVTLSDHMVISSPNFRAAYQEDVDFRMLTQSDIVRISYSNQRERNGPPMNLIELKDFHLAHNLGWPDVKEFFAREGSSAYLLDLQGKPEETSVAFDGSLRDPLFTLKILENRRCDYLKRHLGRHLDLFEDVIGSYYDVLSQRDVPFGIVYFVESRPGWKGETVLDAFLKRLPDTEPDEAGQAYRSAIYNFAKSYLTRSELDLMRRDPILPPEERTYVEVLHGKTVEQIADAENCRDPRVFKLSSDLDDAVLYRHIDYATIARLRGLPEAGQFFDSAEPGPPSPALSDEARMRHLEQRAARFGDALLAYRRRLDRELRDIYSQLSKPSLERTVTIRVASFANDLTHDREGKPRRFLSSVVDCSIALGAAHLGAADAWPLLRFLNTMLTTHVTKAEQYVADLTEGRLKELSASALANTERSIKMEALTAASTSLLTGTGFTVYRGDVE
jgi:hypothetical protein